MALIEAIRRPEIRITIVLLITVAVALLPHAAVILAEAVAVHAHRMVEVAAVPVHPEVEAVVVAEEDNE